MEDISEANLKILLEDIVALDPDHIVITGDITNTAHPNEFTKAKTWLLQLQQAWKPALAPIGTNNLKSELFTIAPGNHDIAKRPFIIARKKSERSRLKPFVEEFGSTLGINDPSNLFDFEGGFPFQKLLADIVDLFVINSTLDVPVHHVGLNAVGEIGERQRIDLAQRLEASFSPDRYRIVICHHHPLTIPYRQEAFEEFLVLRDARRFLKVCFEHRVHLVLHGHKHVPFVWKNVVIPELDPPHDMVVVSAGSPTHTRPGSSLVYNKYVTLRRNLGGKISVEKVEMMTRRFNPERNCFNDVGQPIVLYDNSMKTSDQRGKPEPQRY
jgi:3',5'-cyclic AMP phosphodiesterase CpdA